MTEHPLNAGHLGSLIWVLTDRRLIIRHASWLPPALPSRRRLLELMDHGWSAKEIARWYDCDGRAVMARVR